MKRTTRATTAFAAALIVSAAVTTACSHADNHNTGPTLPGQSAATTPLQQTRWFANNFGTPLVATTDVIPKTVEQAHDIRGIVLPQDKSPVDGPVMWQRVRCSALPFSTTDGPTTTRADGIYGGYSHTPLGAALAAFHMANFITAGSVDAARMVIAPADRDRLTPLIPNYRRGTNIDNPSCLAQHKNIIRPAFWNADTISPTVTRVGYWWPPRPGEQQGYSLDYTVQWQHGDWYLTEQTAFDVLALAGSVPRQAQYTDEPVGWSQW